MLDTTKVSFRGLKDQHAGAVGNGILCVQVLPRCDQQPSPREPGEPAPHFHVPPCPGGQEFPRMLLYTWSLTAVSQTSGLAHCPDVPVSFSIMSLNLKPKLIWLKKQQQRKQSLISQSSYNTVVCISNGALLSLSCTQVYYGFLCTKLRPPPTHQTVDILGNETVFICFYIPSPYTGCRAQKVLSTTFTEQMCVLL